MSIEFRAWDIRNKRMVGDALLLSETGQLVTVNAKYFNSPFSFFDGCVWLQFTGKFSKEKKKIYTGDILAFRNDIPCTYTEPDEPNNDLVEVYYNNDKAAFYCKSNKYDYSLGQMIDEYGDPELCGHIFDGIT